MKTRQNRKWKIPHAVLERWTMCFSSYKNWKVKSNIVMNWSSRKKKECIFCNSYFVRRKFNIWVSSQCIVYWINFRILSPIKKHYLIHFCCLFLKLSQAFSCTLNLRKVNRDGPKRSFSRKSTYLHFKRCTNCILRKNL